MEPEQDIGEDIGAPLSGKPRHPAGAGLGLVGLILGSSIFAVSILLGFYLWHMEHSVLWFLGTAAIGWAASFTLRRMSLR